MRESAARLPKPQPVRPSPVQEPAQRRVTGEIINHRPEAVAQRRLAEMIDNSPRMAAQRQQAEWMNSSPHAVAQARFASKIFGKDAVHPPAPSREPTKQKKKARGNNPLQLRAQQPAAMQPKKKNNTGLPDNLKAGIENLSGYSMDDVKVHYNSNKPAQLQALAYAQGTDIHVASGKR